MKIQLKEKSVIDTSQKQVVESKKTPDLPPQPMTTISSGPIKEVSSIPTPKPLTPSPPTESPAIASSQLPTPTTPPPGRSPEVRKGPGVVFNFDNADIYEVIRVMAEIMKINYIIDPRVKGVVNIHTAGQIAAEEVFPIFQSILRLNGATAVKKDNLYEIIPLMDAKKLFILPSTTRESGKFPSEERYMIQIVPLKYIPVTEVSKIVKPFLSDGADIIEHPPHNILIIGDIAPNVKKSLDIINLFDIDIFTDLKVRIYPVLNADVTEIAKEMERIFSSFEVSLKSARGVGITFTPITRINSLLVVSSIPHIFEKVEGWLKELDRIPAEGTKLGVFVYYVQNAKAKDLAEVLKQIFVAPKEKKPEFKEKVVEPTPPRGVKPSPPPSPAPPKEEAPAIPEGEINIVVDEANNALVIRAYARDYQIILETIKKLDIYPKQVLIEVMLAEITLDDETQFGIEWARFLTSHPPVAQEIVMGEKRPPAKPFSEPLAAIGLRYSIVELGGRVSAAIKAAAKSDRLKVISSPNILASNNKEAKIQIGVSQPILTTTYTAAGSPTVPAGTTATGYIEGTIEYKDIGIILTVTPRISDGGLVTMEINIEDSSVDSTSLGTLSNIPFFKKKTAKTVLSVLESQMIVIGGLMEDSKDATKSGVPLLSRIPILGALFGTHRYTTSKKELILLMTPHIITDHIQSDAVTREFREKLEGIRKELEKMEKKK